MAENIAPVYEGFCFINFIDLNQKLYWTQQFCSLSGVFSFDLSSRQQTAILSRRNGYYNGITAYNGEVYWTGLGRISSTHGELIPPFSRGVALFKGLKIVHPSLQPTQQAQ